MTALTSYLIAFLALFQAVDPGWQSSRKSSMQAGEWLLFEPLDLPLSGPYYDVAFYQDQILFMKSGEKTLYQAPLQSPDPVNAQALFVNLDISCSPAAMSFSSDYTKGYYTRPVHGGNEQVPVEEIFEFDIEGKQASGLTQLPFSMDPSRNLHPTVSSDGSLMVFSSDRLPSNGGLDLFVSSHRRGGWTRPMNMGVFINTSGHEWFPYLDAMNNLWFSSTGHGGYGGFDIFLCPYREGEWEKPLNLGSAFNGPQDELGFSVHPGKQVALFSRAWPSEDKGLAFRVRINEEALVAAGINEAAVRDIILLIQGMAEPAIELEQPSEAETNTDPPVIPDPVVAKKPPGTGNGQEPVVFRIQIISTVYENSIPTVLIDGLSYRTWEYYYLGAYRITVGEFYSFAEASAFKLRCLQSGFKQAFVAAFRGGERITDPEVFKQ